MLCIYAQFPDYHPPVHKQTKKNTPYGPLGCQFEYV